MTFIVNEDGVAYQKDLGKKNRGARKGHAGIQPRFQLAQGGGGAGANRECTEPLVISDTPHARSLRCSAAFERDRICLHSDP